MLSLNYRDARPIYEQVRDGLRHLVVTGAIIEGEPLPTAEVLAEIVDAVGDRLTVLVDGGIR